MSYIAIARKWRPKTFDEIAGQEHVTRTLKNAIRLQRIHHAFLFTGARGVGKTTAARALARALNCEAGPTPTPCGECATCIEVSSGNSPDVIEIDGASNNSVEDVRDLRESVRYLPQRGHRKVYIVDEVHMLSKGAFNALLKTLEEPPEHVIFIFATTEPQKIPDTILSRVQRFDFKRIPVTIVMERLRTICEAENLTIPDEALRLIARSGEGSMRDAQSLLDQVISFGGDEVSTKQVAEILGLVDRNILYAMLEGMLKGEADKCLEAIERVYSYGYDLGQFTSEMLELLRNATLVGLSPLSKRYLDVPDEERAQLEQLAADLPSDLFVRSFNVMLDVHDQVSRAQQPRLVLEMAVARLVTIRPARPMDQLIDRLSNMERKLRQGGIQARSRTAQHPGNRPSNHTQDDEPDPAPTIAVPKQVPSVRTPAWKKSPAKPATIAPQTSTDILPPATDTDADDVTRFAAFQRWADKGGARYELWARDSILGGTSDGTLTVLMPSDFAQNNSDRMVHDAHLRQGLKAYFPQCKRLVVHLRDKPESQFTPREQSRKDRRAMLKALHEEMEQHPLIEKIKKETSAQIISVIPCNETLQILGETQ